MGVIECVFDEAIDDGGLADVLIANEYDFGFLDVLLVGGVADFLVVLVHSIWNSF